MVYSMVAIKTERKNRKQALSFMLRIFILSVWFFSLSLSLSLFRSVQTDEQLDDSSQKKTVARVKKPFTLYEKRKKKILMKRSDFLNLCLIIRKSLAIK